MTRPAGYAPIVAAALVGGLVGCSTDDGASGGDDVAVDVGGETDADLDADVATDTYFSGGAYILPESHANVMRKISFTAEVEPGIAEGFDLDGRVSEAGDPESCGHGDRVSPDGRDGIDNQFAELWGLIQPLVGEQVEELLQGAINEGRVLVAAELAGVNDLRNDPDVTFNLYRVLLDPDVGTFGLIAPDQTFYMDYDKPLSTVSGAAIVDGWVEAGPLRLDLPINVLELDIVLPLEGAYVRFHIDDDGTFSGVMGGAFNVPSVIDAVLATPAAEEMELVAPFFRNNADMQRVDGACEMLSATFGFEGTTAFVVRDASRE
ncbi:MAG: hypothetical protein H6698_00110 [Myxococcales bacterium]|nr:hypothetical protein [Myxococcales bacterium]MCB9532715.1 hypothetical protein [Myxococcales bacterium]